MYILNILKFYIRYLLNITEIKTILPPTEIIIIIDIYSFTRALKIDIITII